VYRPAIYITQLNVGMM